MEKNFNCPCCQNNNWSVIKDYHFEDKTNSRYDDQGTNYKTSILKKRQQILFDIWFPGQQELTLTSMYCKVCGFVCYSPRPNKDDLKSKYQHLSKSGSIGTLAEATPRALSLDRKRETFMKKVVDKFYKGASKKILDVGGGDGRLMQPFLEDGYSCYLVDFNLIPHPGIERIGSTLEDIPEGQLFDVIICSHVLEHVSDPGEFLRQLNSFLTKSGVVYIEVPLEIWGGISISKDPVTHINFFTVQSLKNALLLNGLKPLAIEGKFATYNGKYKRVAWTVATASGINKALNNLNSVGTEKLINPGIISKIKRRAENFWLQKVLN